MDEFIDRSRSLYLPWNRGKLFFHGSPFLFDQARPATYYTPFPTLSLAILTEKCVATGYVYIYRLKEDQTLRWDRLVNGLFFRHPTPVDELGVQDQSYMTPDYLCETNDFYHEFILDTDELFDLLMIYKVDVNLLRQRVIELMPGQTINSSIEDILIREFLPTGYDFLEN